MSFLTPIVDFVKSEPAVILTVVGAGLGAASTFGLNLDATQTKEVFGAVTAITGFVIRGKVTPSATVNARVSAVEAKIAEYEPLINSFVPASARSIVTTAETALANAEQGAAAGQAAVPSAAPVNPDTLSV